MTDKNTSRDPRLTWAVAIALAVSTVAVYARSLGGDFTFVNVDDNHYVTANPHVQRGLSAESIRYAFTTFDGFNWHPVTWLSLQLDTTLFGVSAAAYRRTNVLLHAANAVLLFWLLRRLTGDFWPSAAVAALFALHPLQVESVAWITERKGCLAGLFWLLTMAAYARYVERPGIGRYLLIFVPFILGLMSKAVLVTLPPALLLLDYWPLRRWRRDSASRYVAASPGRLVLEKVPLLVLVAAVSFVTARSGKPIVGTLEQYPVSERLAVIPVNYVTFLRMLVWPSGLTVYYPHPHATLPWWQPVGAVALLVAITIAAIAVVRSRRHLAVGWFWYLGTIAPVIGIVQLATHARTDHYAYLPSIGMFMMAAWGVAEFCPIASPRAKIAGALTAVALASCAAVTWQQIGYWRDGETLWRHALEVSGESYVAHERLGMALAEKGQWEEAEAHLRAALGFHSGKAEPWGNLGFVLERQGRIDEAAAMFDRMIELDPASPRGYAEAGRLRLLQGRPDDAVRRLGAAVRLEPNSSETRLLLIDALAEQGDFARARAEIDVLLARDPQAPTMLAELGRLLWRERKLIEALAALDRALAREPTLAYAWNYKGLVLQALDRRDDATAAFRRAVRLAGDQPVYRLHLGHALYIAGNRTEAGQQFAAASRQNRDWPHALLAQAWRRATHPDERRRDGAQALRQATIVCEATDFRVPEALDVLAAAHAELGQFDEAAERARAALKLVPPEAPDTAKAIRARLSLYEKRQPYREDPASAAPK